MSDSFLAMMLQSLTALAAVLALFAGLVWLVRRLQAVRFQPQDGGGQMKIVQRLALDTRHSLVEVACGQHHHLIGLSPDGMTPISRNIPIARNADQAQGDAAQTTDN